MVDTVKRKARNAAGLIVLTVLLSCGGQETKQIKIKGKDGEETIVAAADTTVTTEPGKDLEDTTLSGLEHIIGGGESLAAYGMSRVAFRFTNYPAETYAIGIEGEGIIAEDVGGGDALTIQIGIPIGQEKVVDFYFEDLHGNQLAVHRNQVISMALTMLNNELDAPLNSRFPRQDGGEDVLHVEAGETYDIDLENEGKLQLIKGKVRNVRRMRFQHLGEETGFYRIEMSEGLRAHVIQNGAETPYGDNGLELQPGETVGIYPSFSSSWSGETTSAEVCVMPQ